MAQGALPASLALMASAWAWVSRPALTSSASVSPIAFWKAALTLLWLVPRSEEKWEMNSLQTPLAAGPPVWSAMDAAAFGLAPNVNPAAEAVTKMAAPAMAAAPR